MSETGQAKAQARHATSPRLSAPPRDRRRSCLRPCDRRSENSCGRGNHLAFRAHHSSGARKNPHFRLGRREIVPELLKQTQHFALAIFAKSLGLSSRICKGYVSCLTKVDAKCRRSPNPRTWMAAKPGRPAAKANNCLVIKTLGRGLGGSLPRPMIVAIIAGLLPFRIGRSF
jgi:hypothetical protein